MGDVINLSLGVPEGLRNIADAIEDGSLLDDTATVIVGMEVFHFGCVDSGKAAVDAIWNMAFGIHKLMRAAVED